MRRQYLWPFAELLHTPPPMWDRLTVAETDDGIAYLQARAAASAQQGGLVVTDE